MTRPRILPEAHHEGEVLLTERQRIQVARLGGAAWMRRMLDEANVLPELPVGPTKPYRFRCTSEQLGKLRALGSSGVRRMIERHL